GMKTKNTSEDLDGPDKNRAVVAQQFDDLKAELATIPPRLAAAWRDRDVLEFLHTLSNYLEEPIDKLPRFWFYTWPLKWGAVGLIIWIAYKTVPG
ncbi:MAG: hypothetical protein AAGB19_14415, partial [Cyanobacteria bacterium P01_F01_bin.3]